MQAVIKTGGKQYRVAEGDTLRVEKLIGEAGSSIEFSEVLSVGEGDSIKIGSPTVAGATVIGQIVSHGKAKKLIVFKKRKRKGFARKHGHRQMFTSVKIQQVKL
ncbi:MAG: 50S ribosomal protein L21 [Deltaproteobacteria bacterium]|nr:50S ribosomal protein L21 [Deltaproteobacteria bacterium]